MEKNKHLFDNEHRIPTLYISYKIRRVFFIEFYLNDLEWGNLKAGRISRSQGPAKIRIGL